MLTGSSLPVASPWGRRRGRRRNRGRKREEEGRKDGGKYRSEQASFSEASQAGEKGRREPDGHLCVCGDRGSQGPPILTITPMLPAHLSSLPLLLLMLLPCCCWCCCYCCFKTHPEEPGWAPASPHSPQAQSGGWPVSRKPLLPLMPPPGSGPSSPSSSLHLLPH